MDPCHKKLESAWTHYREQKDWRMCGKILRDTINLLKSVDGGLAEYESDLAAKTEFLESMLSEMHFDVSLTVISHLRHARNNLKLTNAVFGSAFKRELGPKERRKIRRRNTAPRIDTPNGLHHSESNAIGRYPDGFHAGSSGGSE
jgi:hypothetical protein